MFLNQFCTINYPVQFFVKIFYKSNKKIFFASLMKNKFRSYFPFAQLKYGKMFIFLQIRAGFNPKNSGSSINHCIFTRTKNNYTCMVFNNLHQLRIVLKLSFILQGKTQTLTLPRHETSFNISNNSCFSSWAISSYISFTGVFHFFFLIFNFFNQIQLLCQSHPQAKAKGVWN